MAEAPAAAVGWIEAGPVLPAGVRAGTTTRQGGVSLGPRATLNLAAHVGDAPAAVLANRERLGAALRLPAPPRWLSQVHGTDVAATTPARVSRWRTPRSRSGRGRCSRC